MKRTTLTQHTTLANNIMYYIYTHIDTDINLDELASHFKINKYYMHKIFKSIFGRNIYESIKSIRLQKASNLLLSNRHSTISEVAQLCGYSSQTSFIRAFKARFGMTPKQWRQGGYHHYSNTLLYHQPQSTQPPSFHHLSPQIVKMPELQAYYIRHIGYDESIKQTWQKLQTWLYDKEIAHYTMLSLFHDNPAITPLEACHHVAAIVCDATLPMQEKRLPMLKLSEGVYAKFHIEGYRADLLHFIRWVYHSWLPQSGYETTPKPPYAIYQKNHHLSSDGRFEMDFYLSVRY